MCFEGSRTMVILHMHNKRLCKTATRGLGCKIRKFGFENVENDLVARTKQMQGFKIETAR